ncbi:ABC transporter ATP-binding protein [Kribbella sp. CA-247076]|uniref:ABC transporter ATP-binding protein n=1 Tax=Kribbella sp. CA-247076 TaxID=3239941 RepID=UPI003D9346B9
MELVVRPASRQRLVGLLVRGRSKQLAGLGVLLVVSSAVPLAGPQLIRLFIDQAVLGRPVRLLILIAAGFLAVSIVNQVLSVVVAYASARLAWDTTNELREEVADHVLRLDPAFHDRHTPGELIERTDGDVSALSSFVSSFVVQLAGSTLTLIGVLVLVFLEDWRLGAGLLGFVAVATATIAALRNVAVPRATELRAASARMFGEIEERLYGAEDLRANAGGSHAVRRFQDVLAVFSRASIRAAIATRTTWVVTIAVFAAGGILSLVAGSALFEAGAITLGTVYLLFRYTTMVRDPLEQIADQQHVAQEAIAGFSRVQQLLDERPAISDLGRHALPTGPLPVALDRVSFVYPNGAKVLHDIDLTVPAGGVLGVVGRTGSGKTTLTRLLLRLLEATEGELRIGGLPVQEVRLAELRKHVALVTQDVQLFEATLRDNLTLFGAFQAGDDRLTDVLRELGLGPWYDALPDGLDTELGAGGAGASAGEAQLVAFARVFLRDPGVVILDEATSRLDPVSERLIERAIDRLVAGRTAIVIAHRLSTLDRADDIVVLERGRIVEHGPRRDLAADPGSRFAGLLATASEGVLR